MTGTALVNQPVESWRQRFVRSLLYGRNVDRNAKARARVGLAILVFAAVYAVIGGRLVMFAIGADSHSARRAAAQDAIHLLWRPLLPVPLMAKLSGHAVET